MTAPASVPRLKARPENAHKGTMGRLLVIGASPGLTGAVALAGEAALRSGTGLVTVAVPASLDAILEIKLTEAMTLGLPERPPGALAEESLRTLVPALETADAVVLGPGLGRAPETTTFVEQLLGRLRVPHVVDADALWHLAQLETSDPFGAPDQRVLTPHQGELRRLLAAARITAPPSEAAAQEWLGRPERSGPTLVLKGPGSLVLTPGSRYQNETGNPGMATGGSGDVLAGVIGAFLARGESPWDATVRAVWLHGRAGDLAAEAVGQESLIASDLIRFLPVAIRELSSDTACPSTKEDPS